MAVHQSSWITSLKHTQPRLTKRPKYRRVREKPTAEKPTDRSAEASRSVCCCWHVTPGCVCARARARARVCTSQRALQVPYTRVRCRTSEANVPESEAVCAPRTILAY